MESLGAKELKKKIDQEEKICVVDVRSIDEFNSGHVPGAICIPVDSLEQRIDHLPRNQLLVLNCQSGNRSRRAKEILLSHGFTSVLELDGGINAWVKSELPIQRLNKRLPLIRQVQLVAGLLVASGTLLGLFVHPGFFAIPLFVGCGLMFAGLSGWCGMALLLEKMPWNQS